MFTSFSCHRLSALIVIFCFTATAQSQPQNVHVSADTVSRYSPCEVSIAINPRNPLAIVAGSNAQWLYTSSDGGQTWASAMLRTDFGSGCDPSLAFDDESNLYFASLGTGIGISRSRDGGMSFDTGATVGLEAGVQDKPTLAVDKRAGSGNTLALAWTRFDHYNSRKNSDTSRILCSISHDRGLTWSTPVRVDDAGGDCLDSSNTAEGAVPAFGPNGELYIVWSARDTIFFDKSLDGGVTFGRDKVIAVQPGGWNITEKRIFRANGIPVAVCDQFSASFKGRIYVLWGEVDDRSSTRHGVPDAYFICSADGGQTWSQPQNLTSADTAQHLFPTLAVDPITGHLFVAYYSMHPENGYSTDVYLACSTDGGGSFTTSKVSESQFYPGNGAFLGDYISVAAYNRHVVPIWTRADKNKTSIWAALVFDTADAGASGVRMTEDENPTQLRVNTSCPLGLELVLPASARLTIEVFDALGRKCGPKYRGKFDAGKHRIPLYTNLSNGPYLITILDEERGAAWSWKFLFLR